MACFNPVPAFRTASGDVVMVERGNIVASLTLACGRCIGCRTERARQWSVRLMHEASLYDENCFVTLTYNEESVPPGGTLRYRDFQRFMKYLRRDFPDRRIRFFMCGEYGDQKGRPHYHAAIFNFRFASDRYVWKDAGSGFVVYRSPTLERLWSHGSSSIGELTAESANYIARYVNKKVLGDRAAEHYKVVDSETGEVSWREPEFARMSNRPGIGADWFKKFSSDVFPHDRVVVGGRETKPPRYYDKLFKKMDSEKLAEIKAEREAQARIRWPDNTPERLVVRQAVLNARLASFRRKLK